MLLMSCETDETAARIVNESVRLHTVFRETTKLPTFPHLFASVPFSLAAARRQGPRPAPTHTPLCTAALSPPPVCTAGRDRAWAGEGQ